MGKRQKQQRQTLPKRITAFARQWKFRESLITSRFGRFLTEYESMLWRYYRAIDQERMAMKGIITTPFIHNYEKRTISAAGLREIQREVAESREAIINAFMQAVDNYDPDAIIKIASAVWFMKGKTGPNAIIADPERMILLFLKAQQASSGERLTIREIARYVSTHGAPGAYSKDAAADGFSSLRRKCKQLGLWIAPSRPIRIVRKRSGLIRGKG